jgi:hypothetical protein
MGELPGCLLFWRGDASVIQKNSRSQKFWRTAFCQAYLIGTHFIFMSANQFASPTHSWLSHRLSGDFHVPPLLLSLITAQSPSCICTLHCKCREVNVSICAEKRLDPALAGRQESAISFPMAPRPPALFITPAMAHPSSHMLRSCRCPLSLGCQS